MLDNSIIVNPEVFISYSRCDGKQCTRIADALRSAGVTVWIDEDAIIPGENWINAIFEALQRADYVIVLLSLNSVASAWVEQEISAAVACSVSSRSVMRVIPVLLDSVDIPLPLRTFQTIDLTHDEDIGIQSLVKCILDGPQEKAIHEYVKGGSVMQSRNWHYANKLTPSKNAFFALANAVLKLFNPKSLQSDSVHNSTNLRSALEHVHLLLGRLEGIVHEIGELPANQASLLWDESGDYIWKSFPDRSPDGDTTFAYRIMLLKRFAGLMRELSRSLEQNLRDWIQFQSPELANALKTIFRTKSAFSEYGALKNKFLDHKQAETYIAYVQACATLEQEFLLNIWDPDFRGMSNLIHGESDIFSRLALLSSQVETEIISARRIIGAHLARTT